MTDKSNIVAFSGVHGTGKTTAVYETAADLKKQGKNVGIILETARKCPLPVLSLACSNPSPEAQQWIFTRQILEEIEASMRYEVLVTDRTVVDAIAYTRYFGYSDLACAMERIAKHRFYDVIHFKSIKLNDWCIYDGFRRVEENDLRSKLECIMLNIYAKLEIPIILE